MRFNAQYLWSCHNSFEVSTNGHPFQGDILQDEVFLLLSEVHLCADLVTLYHRKMVCNGMEIIHKVDICEKRVIKPTVRMIIV